MASRSSGQEQRAARAPSPQAQLEVAVEHRDEALRIARESLAREAALREELRVARETASALRHELTMAQHSLCLHLCMEHPEGVLPASHHPDCDDARRALRQAQSSGEPRRDDDPVHDVREEASPAGGGGCLP